MFYIIDIIDIMQTQEQEGDGVILLDHLIGDKQRTEGKPSFESLFKKCLALESRFPM